MVFSGPVIFEHSRPPSRGSLDGMEFLGEVEIEVPACPMCGEKLVACVGAEANGGRGA